VSLENREDDGRAVENLNTGHLLQVTHLSRGQVLVYEHRNGLLGLRPVLVCFVIGFLLRISGGLDTPEIQRLIFVEARIVGLLALYRGGILLATPA
jgi:hypothetical protein